MEQATRQRGLDLLRILCMGMVVVLHLLGRGGVLAAAEPLSARYQAAWLLESAAYCAVNCYAILSGYLLCRSRCGLTGLVKLWLQVLFWSAGVTLLFALFWEPVSVMRFLKSCLPVLTGQYWYFTAYFGVYCLAPYFNRLIAHLEQKEFRRLLVLLFLLLSLLPTLVGQDPFQTNAGYSLLWLSALYFGGAYLRVYGLSKPGRPLFWLLGYLACVLTAFTGKWAVESATLARLGTLSGGDRFVSYPSPLILGAAVCLFLACKDLRLEGRLVKGLLAFFAPVSFGVYLIHTQPFVFHRWLNGAVAPVLSLGAVPMMGALLALAAGVFLVCSLLEWGRVGLFRLLRLDRLAQWVGEAAERLLERI